MNELVVRPRRMPPRLIVGVFAAVFILLAAGYHFLLQPSYAPVFTQMRPADASAVVGQLDAQGVPHRLADGGTAVLVPEGRVDEARVMIAGSDIPMKGAVGFELFNKSDMGLTDFAQKINYQRALQGELERTIMMTEGVERARVHLALPERSLFRVERSTPKAAVEVVPAAGGALDEARVAGLQRLVASAVPDLAPADVTVLDGNGRVLSGSPDAVEALNPEAEQRQALERYYRARARAAAEQTLPGVRIEVQVAAVPREAAADTSAPRAAAPKRDFALKVTLGTAAPLDPEDAELVRTAVSSSLQLEPAAGDALSIRVASAGADVAPALPRADDPAPAPAPAGGHGAGGSWLSTALLLLFGGAVLLGLVRRRSPRLSAEERNALAARLRAALREGGEHAAS